MDSMASCRTWKAPRRERWEVRRAGVMRRSLLLRTAGRARAVCAEYGGGASSAIVQAMDVVRCRCEREG